MKKIGIFINDDETFKNGCIQQPHFVWKSLKMISECEILSYDLKEVNFGNETIKTRFISNTTDESDIDLILFVSTQIIGDEIYIKWAKQNVKVINLICGNWFVILQEDMVFDCHKRVDNSIFNRHLSEIWLMPMYKFSQSWISAMSNKKVSMFPYIWDPEIINNYITTKNLNCKYNIHNKINKINILITEPNMSIHKTCMVPLAICEKFETRYPGIINKIFILGAPKTNGFKQIISKLKINSKIEKYQRVNMMDILHQTNALPQHTVLVTHHTLNSLNFVHLEATELGFPILHNCKPFSSIGHYYNDENIDLAINGMTNLVNNLFTGNYSPHGVGKIRSEVEKVHYRYKYDNPEVLSEIKKLIT